MPSKKNDTPPTTRPIHDPAFGNDSHYSVRHSAQGMDCSTKTVRRWIEAGILPAVKLPGGREWRIRGADLNALIADMESSR